MSDRPDVRAGRPLLLALAAVLLIGGASYGVSRWLVSQDVEKGRPLAEERSRQRQAADNAEKADVAQQQRNERLSSLLDNISKQLAERPNDSMLVISAANICYDLGRYAEAVTYYKRFIDNIDPNNHAVNIDYGYAVFETGRQNEGIAIIEQVLKSEPRNQIAMFNIGVMYVRSNNPDRALIWMKKCRDVDPASDIGKRAANVIQTLQQTS